MARRPRLVSVSGSFARPLGLRLVTLPHSVLSYGVSRPAGWKFAQPGVRHCGEWSRWLASGEARLVPADPGPCCQPTAWSSRSTPLWVRFLHILPRRPSAPQGVRFFWRDFAPPSELLPRRPVILFRSGAAEGRLRRCRTPLVLRDQA